MRGYSFFRTKHADLSRKAYIRRGFEGISLVRIIPGVNELSILAWWRLMTVAKLPGIQPAGCFVDGFGSGATLWHYMAKLRELFVE